MLKDKYLDYYMTIALETAKLSYCQRAKVGSVIVKENKIISYGYNGTLPGQENVCEQDGKTKPTVVHAEANAILKVAGSNESCKDAVLFVTLTPCVECAKMIIASGISAVYYHDEYRCDAGVKLLEEFVFVKQWRLTDAKEQGR